MGAASFGVPFENLRKDDSNYISYLLVAGISDTVKKIIVALILLLTVFVSTPWWLLNVLPPGELYGKLFYFLHSSSLDRLVDLMEEGGRTHYKWYEGYDLKAGDFGIDGIDIRDIDSEIASAIVKRSQDASITHLWADKRDIGWLIFAGYESKYGKDMIMSFLFGRLPEESIECRLAILAPIDNGSCHKDLSAGWYLWFNW